jgi:hypothetical protein
VSGGAVASAAAGRWAATTTVLQWPATLEPAKAPKIDDRGHRRSNSAWPTSLRGCSERGEWPRYARRNSEAEKRDPVFANTSLLAAVNILNRDVYSFGSLVGFPP